MFDQSFNNGARTLDKNEEREKKLTTSIANKNPVTKY